MTPTAQTVPFMVKPHDRRSVSRTMRLDAATDRIIRDNLAAGESYAAVIDRIVREWAQAQPQE